MNTVEDQNENRQNGNLNREVFAGDPMHFASGLLLSSKIGPVLANNFPPQLLKNLFSVSEAPALIIKVQYLALMRQPVQQSCCEDSVAKKLRPAIKAFI